MSQTDLVCAPARTEEGVGGVAAVVQRYERARTERDMRGLSALQAPIYHHKHLLRGAVAATRDGAMLADAPIRSLSQVQMCFEQLAIARLDDWGQGLSSLVFLLRDERGAWRIAGEAAGSALGRQVRFNPDLPASSVLETLAAYYAAVRDGDPETIARIFDDSWHMKNHEDGRMVCEGKAAFIERIKPGPLPGYDDDRQIADVQIINGELAYVRVDKPSTPSTTVFTFFHVNERWLITDKVWADGRVR
ncbi:MAG: nuclear transport factor 2 family protein [Hyphomonadaceae bacterium]